MPSVKLRIETNVELIFLMCPFLNNRHSNKYYYIIDLLIGFHMQSTFFHLLIEELTSVQFNTSFFSL